MGLLNVQGQVQSIVIGVLLILSILLPNLPQIVSGGRRGIAGRDAGHLHISRRTLAAIAVGVIAAVAFGWFFFWSRAVVFSLS